MKVWASALAAALVLGLHSDRLLADEPADLLAKVLQEAASACRNAKVPVIARQQEPERAALAFSVSEPSGLKRLKWPVRGGIPFARGVLRDAGKVRLIDEHGRPVPVQTKVLATWPEGDVKWLLVEFLTDIDAGETKHFKLIYGSGIEPQTADTRVGTQQGGSILLDGTQIKVTLRTGRSLISEVRFAGRPVLRDLEPFMRLSSNKSSTGWLTEWQITDVRLVENGPVQATARVDGCFLARNGVRWPFHCYVRVYKGCPRIWLQFFWTFADSPESSFPSAYGLSTYKLNGRGDPIIGLDSGWLAGPSLSLIQADSQTCQPGARRGRLAGWAAVVGKDWSVGVHVARAWQNWPSGFDLGGTHLTVYLYGSPDGTPLDLRKPDGKTPRSYLFWQCPLSDYYDGGGMCSPRGIGKTHNLVISFLGPGAAPERLSNLTAAEKPLLPYVLPEYYAETLVFGRVAPFDADPEFLAAELYCRSFCDFAEWLVRAADLTGFIDYGDVPDGGAKFAGSNPQAAFQEFLKALPESVRGNFVLRGRWILEWRGGVGWLEGERTCSSWIFLYLLAGRRKYFDFGYDYLLHCCDIDMLHLGGMKGIGFRHNQVHWRTPAEPRQHPYRAYYQMYWLTGDLRFYDALIEASEHLRKNYANDRFVNAALKKGAAHYPLLLAWQTTGDFRWARHIKPLIKYWSDRIDKGLGIVYADDPRGWQGEGSLQPAAGSGRSLPELPGYFCGYGADDAVIEYMELTGDRDAAHLVLKLAYTILLAGRHWNTYHAPERLLATAYAMTGDSRFVPLMRRCCYWFDPRREEKAVALERYGADRDVVSCFGGQTPFGKNALLIRAAYAREAPYLLWGILEAKRRGDWRLDRPAKMWLEDLKAGKLSRDQWPRFYR